ncbi:MAG: NAD-dependent epimerase/dehydratase family protein [Candidatus Acetothermia bacterium]|jgi:nucleoside-diphosphate-sugar epimerase|nr:NAD-dependent epimerase/dehydratase family protein [Candidatus Acetothermia bacterium]MDH7505152.1 NAD-dependent epimerase/dehydratase family protein [Candidatus Acetothermia bacterium]
MRRVLVTGATGLVGSHAVARLLEEGYEVYGLVRRSSDAAILERLGARPRYGDLRVPSSLLEATQGMDAVVHAAAKVGDWGSRKEFYALNVQATEALLQGALENGVGKFVHVSSVSVYGRTEHKLIAEDEPLKPVRNPYIDTKIAAESRVREYQAKGLVTSIVRPCLIYGERDRHFLPLICKQIKAGRMVIIGSGEHLANLVYAENVVDLLLLLLQGDRGDGEAFNCVDRDLLTWNEALKKIAGLMGLTPSRRHLPEVLAYDLGLLLEVWGRLTRRENPPLLTRFTAKLLGGHCAYDTSKAERLLGYRPRFSTAEGLERSVRRAL